MNKQNEFSNYAVAVHPSEAQKIKDNGSISGSSSKQQQRNSDPGLELKEAKLKKEEIIKKAHEQAELIISEAKTRAKEIAISQAKEDAKKLNVKIEENYKASADLIDNINSEKSKIIDEIFNHIKEVTVFIIHQIVGMNNTADFYAESIDKILQENLDINAITLKLNEEDWSRIRVYLEKSLVSERLLNLNIEKDKSLQKGVCVLEAGAGDFVVSLNSYLQKIYQEIRR